MKKKRAKNGSAWVQHRSHICYNERSKRCKELKLRKIKIILCMLVSRRFFHSTFLTRNSLPKSDPSALFIGILAHGTAANIIDNTGMGKTAKYPISTKRVVNLFNDNNCHPLKKKKKQKNC